MPQATKALKAAATKLSNSSPSSSNGSEKERKKKGLKAAATESPEPPQSNDDGSEMEGEEETFPQSEVDLPKLAARPQYDKILREKWRLELRPEQVSILCVSEW